MKKNSYFDESGKKESNIQTFQSDMLLSNNKFLEDLDKEKIINDNPFNESDTSREDDLPVKEGLLRETTSLIKGLSLAFVFFSVIIYSLLYMLTPEKSANLIFIGNYNPNIFDNNFCNTTKNNFYKLDEIKTKKKSTIINISLYCLKNNDTDRNYLKITIEKNEEDNKIIKVFAKSEKNEKDIYVNNLNENLDNNVIYNDYKMNDFPFWLCLYNKENFDMRNITSEYLLNYF